MGTHTQEAPVNLTCFLCSHLLLQKMMMKQILFLTMTLLKLITSSTVPLQYSTQVDPSQFYFGASNPQPCCRSNFPEEFGSCQANEHCAQATAPYCSAFGYCTQIQRYGYDGCAPCQGYH